MAYLYDTDTQRLPYYSRRQFEDCEFRNPYARIASRLGQVPAVSGNHPTLTVQLAEEMKMRKEARAWTKVEEIYKQLESMGDKAFATIPNVAEIHCIGAEAADIFGQSQNRQTRLVRERDSREKAWESINSEAFREVVEQLDAIEKSYGSVMVTPRSKSVSKKRREQLELVPAVMPPLLEQRRTIEAAAAALKAYGEFNGLLPAGAYVLESGKRSPAQSFTVNAGTELAGKKRTIVFWGS